MLAEGGDAICDEMLLGVAEAAIGMWMVGLEGNLSATAVGQ